MSLALISCNRSKNITETANHSWEAYRGGYENNAYSTLKEINTENVEKLDVAWVYRTGDNQTSSSIQCNPLIIDGILYATTATLKVVALNAATGEEVWKYDPASNGKEVKTGIGGTNRGLTYWEDGEDKRLFYCVMNEIQSIDLKTGKLAPNFGNMGVVDLMDHLDRDIDKETAFIRNTSPGVIYKDVIIMGSSLHESPGSLPGHIRAYDVRNGELKWIFHTIPHPGEFGYDTWPKDYYKIGGGANAWSGFSLDTERGIVYAPLGSPTHDFYGIDRKGKGLFANSLVALDASTGQYKWHFQVSHHDLWDYDIPTPPNLITVNHNGKKIDAVAQLTKQGLVFLLDRETGKPLFEVKELPVPQTNMIGESTWPTQPFPVKPQPFSRQSFDESLITDISEESHEYVKEQIKGYSLGSIYTPPSESGIVQLPGFRGGAEWSGGAYDQETGIMYIGVNDIPNLVQLVEDTPYNEEINEFDDFAAMGQNIYTNNCATCHGTDRKGNSVFPSLTNIKDRITIKKTRDLLKNGRGMMPSFKHISENNRRAVLAYLYGLNNKGVRDLLPISEGKTAKRTSASHDTLRRFKLKAYQQLRDQEGYPGIKPPWGKLCAVDLNSGEIKWEVPLGEYEELTKKGIPPTGTQLFGGGVVTAGGLIFIGASRDEKFRALDKKTGEILWEFQLPVGGYATPSTYSVDGEQYVVIAAGGGGLQGTKSGDYYFAFKLKD
ncbi:outer membrane protein assembly factor BamB family protein [Flagellimonas marina]|uniref:outer membrane protein assembly factor BamB family protein n=1 Tax=Flagellimonas marina TaxID=1775168 RepID=UPI0036D2933C